jgi:GNAT superfamily N-acetyltransferase
MCLIRKLSSLDFESISRIINEAAQVYKGVIPEDRWKEPYMQKNELREEISLGVQFHGWIADNAIVGVMGIQSINDVTLIRHSYVLPRYQRKGIGTQLLQYLIDLATMPTILVGTWETAKWAIRFYENNGFKCVLREEKNRLLRTYWSIPERQVETSTVLRFALAS